MTISKRDLQLGKIALRAGMVTKEQLAKSLAIQKKLEKPVGLGAIFLKKGYISREQLEEIVKLHNDSKDKNGAAETGEKKKKKKKKAKKDKDAKDAKNGSEAPSGSDAATATSGSEAPASASEAKSEAPTNGSESGAATASAPSSEEAKPEAKKDEKKSSKAQPALKKDSTASQSNTSQSDIDAVLLESAPSDAGPIDETDPERRVITCQKCSKKYRIKKKQAGKKFACRKCKTKVKIPRDIFDKPAAGSTSGARTKDKGSAKNPAVKVEEFNLGSGSDVGEVPAKGDKTDKAEKAEKPDKAEKAEDGPTTKKPSAPTKRPSGSASAATTAGKKSGAAAAVKEGGYGDLVKAAADKKVTPLGPKTTPRQRLLGYIQAVVFLGVVVGIGVGIWYWKHLEAEERATKLRLAVEGEWSNVSAPYKAAVDKARKAVADSQVALEKGGELPAELLRDLTTSATDLEKALTGLRPSDATQQVIQAPANMEKARALLAETTPDALIRSIYLMRGRVHLAMGGESHVLEACRDFNEVLKREPSNDEGLALLGQAELRRRNYVAAIEALRKSLAAKSDPKTRAYLALALEAGDLCKDAVKEYEALAANEPLALVFKARALLLDGDADGAIGALDAAKLEGEALAAAQARRGQALERKGDLDGAAKAFEAAAAGSGKSGRAHIARGE
ncbi:MAG: tetratricopeptide repeat protein, partial [Planctomycetota bacterium]